MVKINLGIYLHYFFFYQQLLLFCQRKVHLDQLFPIACLMCRQFVFPAFLIFMTLFFQLSSHPLSLYCHFHFTIIPFCSVVPWFPSLLLACFLTLELPCLAGLLLFPLPSILFSWCLIFLPPTQFTLSVHCCCLSWK